MQSSRYSIMPSPVGPLTLRWSEGALSGLHFDSAETEARRATWELDDDCLAPVRAQLDQYFAGERATFDMPLALEGTAFQREVWRALSGIPFGVTISYGELARRVGKPKGSRAVGAANGQNPVAIIVPCHRVIGADGSLTGFGGGLPRKKILLQLEGSLGSKGASPQLALAAVR